MSRRLLTSGAATCCLYGAILALQPVLRTSSPRLLELQPWLHGFIKIPPAVPEPWRGLHAILARPAVTVGVWAAIVIALFALYGLAFRAVRRGEGSVAAILGFFLLFAAVLAPGIPIFSNDVFAYIALGEVVDTKHVSPYEVRMEDHRDLAISRWTKPLRLGSVYGPLASRVFQVLHVTGASPLENLMIFRTFAIVALFIALVLAHRTLVALGRDAREARALLLFIAWNPLVLLDGVLNVHVDVIIVLLLALGTLLVVRRRTILGLAVLATSAAVKISFLSLAPVLVAWAWCSSATGNSERPLARATRVLQLLGLGAVLHFGWLLPDWFGGSPLTALAELGGHAANSLTFMLRQALSPLGVGAEHLATIAAGTFAFLLVHRSWELRTVDGFLARASRDVMLGLLFFLPVMHPWYALPAFPLVVAGGVRRHIAALVTLSGCFLFVAYGLHMASMETSRAGTKFLQFVFGVLPAMCVFLWGTPRKRVQFPT